MFKNIAQQFRMPEGFLGRIIKTLMDINNGKIYNYSIKSLDIKDEDTILEIGYASGRGIKKIAKTYQNVKIDGIDLSWLMYDKARKVNKKYVKNEKVNLYFGDITDYNNKRNYDKLYAINVIYFCANLRLVFEKIYRMLKEQGKMLIYMKSPKELEQYIFTDDDVFYKYDIEYVINIMTKIGFKNIKIEKNKKQEGSYIIAEK